MWAKMPYRRRFIDCARRREGARSSAYVDDFVQLLCGVYEDVYQRGLNAALPFVQFAAKCNLSISFEKSLVVA